MNPFLQIIRFLKLFSLSPHYCVDLPFLLLGAKNKFNSKKAWLLTNLKLNFREKEARLFLKNLKLKVCEKDASLFIH